MADENGGQSGEQKPFAYDEWKAGIPSEAMQRLAGEVFENYVGQLREQAPALVSMMERSVADPEYRKRIERLNDDKFASYVWDTAAPVFDRGFGSEPIEREAPTGDPQLRADVTDIKSRLEREEQTRAVDRYRSERTQEFEALVKERPELANWQSDEKTRKRVARAIEFAEAQSARSNKRIPYRSVYQDLADEWGIEREEASQAPMRPVPSASSEHLSQPQAPRSAAQAKEKIVQQIRKAGGFGAFAAQVSGRR